MKPAKKTVVILSMMSSILLLLVLLGFWLYNSYEKAFYDLRRESNSVFRTTVQVMRDSLFLKSIDPVPGDTARRLYHARLRSAADTLLALPKAVTAKDIEHIRINKGDGKVQVYVYSTVGQDSAVDMIRNFAGTIQNMPGQRSFTIRISPDSLRTDSIAARFRIALAEAGIRVPFVIHKDTLAAGPFRAMRRTYAGPRGEENVRPLNDRRNQASRLFTDTLRLDYIHVNPIHQYNATLRGIRSVVAKEIAPQIFFGFFLTLLTCGTFMMMYRTMRAQEKLVAIKNDFISNVTHELKTPVATVSVAIEALQNFHALDKPERTKAYLDMAQGELNRLTLMTDKILKASLFEDNGVTLIREKTDLHMIIQQVLTSLQLMFEKTHTVVTYSYDGTNAPLMGSAADLTSVIYNLIDNALKYSPENPVVAISLKRMNAQYVLTISDKGVGIAPEYRKKIFEKFFRVPTGDVHTVKGYGLGLSYVAGVVASHRGSISVDSTKNQGSTFTILLPAS